MKRRSEKRIVWMCIGVMIAVLSGSVAWADFFVIGAGRKAKNTVLVSPKSTEAESGTALYNALSDITDAGETNSYLVLIEPGVYDIGTNSLDMKEYVDIQGSGEKVTKITGVIDSNVKGVLNGANNAEVRFLTVENNSGGSYTTGIYCDSTSPGITHTTVSASKGANCYGITIKNASPILTDVTAISTGGGGDLSEGILLQASSSTLTNVTADASGSLVNYGIVVISSSPTMTVVNAKAEGGDFATGVQFQVSSPIITNLTAKASGAATKSYGIVNHDSPNVKIDDSVITGTDSAVRTITEGCTTYLGCTKLDGGVGGNGSFKCVHCYDSSYNALTTTCLSPP